MQKKSIVTRAICILLCLLMLRIPAGAAAVMESPDPLGIRINPSMIIGGSQEDRNNRFRLFNEFDAVSMNPPHLPNPHMPTPYDIWNSPAAYWFLPGVTVANINFGAACRLYEIWVFDAPANFPSTVPDRGRPYAGYGGVLYIYADVEGNQATFTLLGRMEMENSNTWRKLDLAAEWPGGFETMSLMFTKVQPTHTGAPGTTASDFVNVFYWTGDGGDTVHGPFVCDLVIPQIYIRGVPLGPLTEYTPYIPTANWRPNPETWPNFMGPVTDHNLTIRQFIGTNGFPFDFVPHYEPFGNVRIYSNWSWTENTAGEGTRYAYYSFGWDEDGNPMPIAVFNNRWGVWDSQLQALHDAGVEPILCIQGGVVGAPRAIPNFQGPPCTVHDICMSVGAPCFYDPHSYLAHAQSLFQHAARYGHNPYVPPELIRVTSGTEPRIGLGLVTYYENWNEPNAWWYPIGTSQWTGGMFAAMLSADFDGHMNSMGPDAGIKNADPNSMLVLGGLVGFPYYLGTYTDANGLTQNIAFINKDLRTTEWVYEMMEWFYYNRSLEQWREINGPYRDDEWRMIPFDVMNGHYYSPDSGLSPRDGTTFAPTGYSPEENYWLEKMTAFVAFSHRYFPNMQVWLSEFGFETGHMMRSRFQATHQHTCANRLHNRLNPEEFAAAGYRCFHYSDLTTCDPTTGIHNAGINIGLDQYDVQARWELRKYLLMLAAGLDRVQQYMLVNAQGPDCMPLPGSGMHATPGMVNIGPGDETTLGTWRKPVWYYTLTLNHRLGDFRFDQLHRDGLQGRSPIHDENMTVMSFVGHGYDNTDRAYALWLTSSQGVDAVVPGHRLNVGGYAYAMLVEMPSEAERFGGISAGDRFGVTTMLEIDEAGYVTVDVSERPIFVMLTHEQDIPPEPQTRIVLTGRPITGTGDYRLLTNQQAIVGDPILGIPHNIPISPAPRAAYWYGGNWAEIELEGMYRLTGIALLRRDGAEPVPWNPELQNITIYAHNGQDGWEPLAQTGYPEYDENGRWDILDLHNYTTDRIRIVATGHARVYEIALYGEETDLPFGFPASLHGDGDTGDEVETADENDEAEAAASSIPIFPILVSVLIAGVLVVIIVLVKRRRKN